MLYNVVYRTPGAAPMNRPFRFSIALPVTMRPLTSWREALRQIEDSGFDTVAVADHFTSGYSLEPMVALAAAAMCTTHLRLQTAVLGNDYRHPVLVHRSATLLDVLSEGRLELGLGAGWMASDYQSAGIPYDSNGVRIDRWQESIAIIKGLFGPEPFTFKGEYYSVDHLDGLPKPVQQPRPPFLLGGGGPRVLRIVGREADIAGINTNLASGVQGTDNIFEFTTDAVAEKVGWVRHGAEAAGWRLRTSSRPWPNGCSM